MTLISSIIGVIIVGVFLFVMFLLARKLFRKLKGGTELDADTDMAFKIKNKVKAPDEDLELDEEEEIEEPETETPKEKALKKELENLKRAARLAKEAEEENTEEEVEAPPIQKKEFPISKQELIDGVEGNLARISQLIQLLRRM